MTKRDVAVLVAKLTRASSELRDGARVGMKIGGGVVVDPAGLEKMASDLTKYANQLLDLIDNDIEVKIYD